MPTRGRVGKKGGANEINRIRLKSERNLACPSALEAAAERMSVIPTD